MFRLRSSSQKWTGRQKELPPRVIRTIVSREGSSAVCAIELGRGDTCSIGDHLVAECGDDAFGVEITAIERGEKRLSAAKAEEISTLWSGAIEQVVVKISIHDGRKTVPIYLECDGEQPFVIGDPCMVANRRFILSHIKLLRGTARS